MNPSLVRVLATATLLAAIGTGCETVNTSEPAQPAFQRNMVSEKRVITDASLARRVQVQGINVSEGPGGFLKVQAEILNTTRSYQRFAYKWEWFDKDGNLVEGPASVAVTRQVEGKESLFLQGVAPNAAVRDFRLKLYENAR
ncbi:MAG: DUF1425 domain-containing protein [Verrucomicrobiota bacterium]|jgi:uncharacterized protein YcfL